MVIVLKTRISKALIGLEGEGLTIVKKNGKVYISLEEDLLFASGKNQVGAAGTSALNKLALPSQTGNDLEIFSEAYR